MTHNLIDRAQSFVLIIAVLATLVLAASHGSVGSAVPGSCAAENSSAAVATPASFGGCTSPVGYRMPSQHR